ncbi:unnamed protein product [Colias eurytheme]|nr:unnamed protein product [Colias eurytheme]
MAVIMFLLVGTVFERRIEAAVRRIIELRQAQISQDEASDSTPATRSNQEQPDEATTPRPLRTVSQKNIACRSSVNINANLNRSMPQLKT